MHSSSLDCEKTKDGGEVLVTIAALVTEGRIPGKLSSKTKGFFEGPHCILNRSTSTHKCDLTDILCSNFENVRDQVLDLWKKSIPVCVEVLLTCACKKNADTKLSEKYEDDFLLEKWCFSINHRRSIEPLSFNFIQLINAIRSQLYFSQLTAWLTIQDENSSYEITNQNLRYRLTIPGETFESTNFSLTATKHEFPPTDIGNGYIVNVSCLTLPRMSSVPKITCQNCITTSTTTKPSASSTKTEIEKTMGCANGLLSNIVVDDRMLTYCNIKGKHRCEDLEELENAIKSNKSPNYKKICHNKEDCLICNNKPSTSSYNHSKTKLCVDVVGGASKCYLRNYNYTLFENQEKTNSSPQNILNSHNKNNNNNDDLKIVEDKGKLLLDAIERSGQKCSTKEKCCKRKSDRKCDAKCVQQSSSGSASKIDYDDDDDNDNENGSICDMSESDIPIIKDKSKYNNNNNVFVNNCDSSIPKLKEKRIISNWIKRPKSKLVITNYQQDAPKNINCDKQHIENIKNNCIVDVPSASEQAKFRKELDNAASMVFHSRTGLPLTSSPAPVRRGKSCFDFDSSINSVSAIKSALFPTSVEDESESDGSIVSPCSPESCKTLKRPAPPVKYRKGDAANLLGNFEESVLNGRLEPDSTVHGFTAKVGASGSFVPNQLAVPVTVFFYALIDNDKISSPYLGHINLGKKGYNIPKQGTVQVTLLNPHGTVVKMFVVMYNLSDMPPYSTTFVRQRVVHLPASLAKETDEKEWMEVKWLRYLIHLRFISSKSGKIYLHKDIRIIVYRKTDMDTAVGFNEADAGYELRSFNQMPNNPKFSPRK